MSSLTGTVDTSPLNPNAGTLASVSQDFTTPEGFWDQSVEIPGNDRNARFYDYARLYDGEVSLVVDKNDFPVSLAYRNWFSETCDFFRDFLMSTPPESQSDMQPVLNRALRQSLMHLVMHGVSVFAVEPGRVRAVDPRYFYPLDGYFQGGRFAAEVYPFGSKEIRVRIGTSIRTFTFQGDESNWNYPEGTLGHQTGTLPAFASYYFTVALDPSDGFFGTSIFREMLPAVATFTELMSSYVSQLKNTANIMYIKRDSPGSPIKTGLPAGVEAANPDTSPIKLSQIYGTVVDGGELGFASGVVSPEAFSMPLQRVEQSIYSTAALSPTLVGQFRDQTTLIQSGVAFQKSFVRTSARLNEIIEAFVPVLTQILTVAEAPSEVAWQNPLVALDAMSSASTAPEESDDGDNA